MVKMTMNDLRERWNTYVDVLVGALLAAPVFPGKKGAASSAPTLAVGIGS